MSQTFIAVFISLLAEILPRLGVTVGTEALTTTAQTLIVIGSGIWILIRRHKVGDVTPLGVRKV